MWDWELFFLKKLLKYKKIKQFPGLNMRTIVTVKLNSQDNRDSQLDK